MVASSNYTVNHPVAPAGGNPRASSSFSIRNSVFPTGTSRASSSFSLLVDFSTDGENTIEFSQDAAAMVMAPSDIFADAAVNVQFDTDNMAEMPANQQTADNTIEFGPIADENAIFPASSGVTVEFDGVASEVAELGLGASNIIQLGSTGNSTVEVGAETTLILEAEAAVPPDIDLDRILLFGAENHQKDNVSGPQGGAVDCSRKMATGPVPFLSSIMLASDKPQDIGQVYLVEGLGPKRVIERETVTLNGQMPVSTFKRFTRLCRVTKQSGIPIEGTVSVSAANSIIGMMESASTAGMETTEVLNFLANAAGRATVDTAFYEKFFIKNQTGQPISRLVLSEHQSDFKERVLFAADPTLDNDSTSRNRLTKPGDVNPGDFLTDDNLVFEDIPNGSAVGIWLRLVIPAGEGTVLNGWKLKIEADNVTRIYDLLHPEGSGLHLATTLATRNLHPLGGGNPLHYIELAGGRLVQQVYYEPDPITFRDQFYYNARLNRLFKKINTKPTPVWKVVR